jgi:hypothetical protein
MQNNIKMDFNKEDKRAWTGSIWIRVGKNDRL